MKFYPKNIKYITTIMFDLCVGITLVTTMWFNTDIETKMKIYSYIVSLLSI